MAFNSLETGIERGSTKLVFDQPVIILNRNAESSPITFHELSITGSPVVVQIVRTQTKALLELRVVKLSLIQKATLDTLISGGPVTVKLTPGSSTTSVAVFAAADLQKIEPYLGEHPEKTALGSTLDTRLTTYRADLTLIRLE